MAKVDIFQVVRCEGWDVYIKCVESIDNNIRNEYGQSLLHEAIAYKQNEIALDVISRAIYVNVQDKNGQTPLHFLAFHPNILIAKGIIEAGGMLEVKDKYGNTPLWYSVFYARGKYELVELLMHFGANPISRNNAGKTPIDIAIQVKDETLLNILQIIRK